ncbi:MAG: DUF4397 domain-containing protein [Bacteroidales bacterium]
MKKILPFALILAPLLFVSCEKEDPDPEEETNRAYVMIQNFMLGEESIQWVIGGVEMEGTQSYGIPINGYKDLETTSQDILFVAQNASGTTALDSITLTMENGKYYLVALVGDDSGDTTIVRTLEGLTSASGMVEAQFIHGSPGAEPIDVYLGGTDPEDRAISDLAFGHLSDAVLVEGYNIRYSLIIADHADSYEESDKQLEYLLSDQILDNHSYLFILGHEDYSPDSDLAVWLYDLPIE